MSKKYTIYVNTLNIKSFIKDDDLIKDIEKGKFLHYDKKFKFKISFFSTKKVNRICSEYNLSIAGAGNFIPDN